jgi:hypothetical protein
MGSLISKLFGSDENQQQNKNEDVKQEQKQSEQNKDVKQEQDNNKDIKQKQPEQDNQNQNNIKQEPQISPQELQNQKLSELFKSLPSKLEDFPTFWNQYLEIGQTKEYDEIFYSKFEPLYIENLTSTLSQIQELYNLNIENDNIEQITNTIKQIEELQKLNYEPYGVIYAGKVDTMNFKEVVDKMKKELSDKIKTIERNTWLFLQIENFLKEILCNHLGYTENAIDNDVGKLDTIDYDGENGNYMPLDMYNILIQFSELLPILYTEQDINTFLKLNGELHQRIKNIKQNFIYYYKGLDESTLKKTDNDELTINNKSLKEEELKKCENRAGLNKDNYVSKIKSVFKSLGVFKIKMLPYLACVQYPNYNKVPDVYPICCKEIEKIVAGLMMTNRIITIVNMRIQKESDEVLYFKIDDEYTSNYDLHFNPKLWDGKTKIEISECENISKSLFEKFKGVLTLQTDKTDLYKDVIDRLFIKTLDNQITIDAVRCISANKNLFEQVCYYCSNDFKFNNQDLVKNMYVYNVIDYLSYGGRIPTLPSDLMTKLITAESYYDFIIPINNSNNENDVNNFNVEMLNYELKKDVRDILRLKK